MSGSGPAEGRPHDVARDHRQPPGFVEIGRDDAVGRAIDDVVGDDATAKAEFGEQAHLAQRGAIVADDLDVIAGIVAHGGEGALTDDVVCHHHAIGAETVHAVAIFAGAATGRADPLDPVRQNLRAVMPFLGAPYENAIVGAVAQNVARDGKPSGVGGEDRRARIRDPALRDEATTAAQLDRGRGGVVEHEPLDLAIIDILAGDERDIAPVFSGQEKSPQGAGARCSGRPEPAPGRSGR